MAKQGEHCGNMRAFQAKQAQAATACQAAPWMGRRFRAGTFILPSPLSMTDTAEQAGWLGLRAFAAMISLCSFVSWGILTSTAVLSAESQGQTKLRDAVEALARGDAVAAAAAYSEVLSNATLPNDRRAVVLNERAVAYARLGQAKAALEDFNRAAQLFPEYAAIYNNRGTLLLSLAQYQEAIKDFDRALLLAPGYTAAYNNRAGALLKLGRTAEAIRDYTAAIRLAPHNAAPLSGRGQVFLALSRPHAAIRDFTRAVTVDARFASAYRNRAEARLLVEQNAEAIEDLSRAIAFDVNNAELYILRGNAYLATDAFEAAIKDFSRAIELAPNAATGYAARGFAHGQARNIEEALADLNKAIELDPRSAAAFAYRAYVYKLNDQPDVGESDVNTAWQINPNLPEVLWAKAEIDEATGQRERAISSLRRVVSLRPAFKLAIKALDRLGVGMDSGEDTPEPALGLDKWQVVSRGGFYYAVNSNYPRLRVPLETLGEGQPRILEWEEKRAPLRGIGTLRFFAGTAGGQNGKEEIEQVAILDLWEKKVIAIEPHRQGSKTAAWTWSEGKVVVASTDGVTDEYVLRTARVAEETSRRRYSGDGSWEEGWGQRRRPRRSKSFFDLLFGF